MDSPVGQESTSWYSMMLIKQAATEELTDNKVATKTVRRGLMGDIRTTIMDKPLRAWDENRLIAIR